MSRMIMKVKIAHATHRVNIGWFLVGLSVGAEAVLLAIGAK